MIIKYLGIFCFCLAVSASPKALAQTESLPVVTAPPAALQLDRSYYKKYIDASGIPIVASSTVSDVAMFNMKYIVDTMADKDWYALQALRQNVKRVLIIPKNDGMTTLPEYVNLDQLYPLPGSTWNQRTQGIGWTETIPYVSCSEANLLRSGKPLDRYPDESICIHEFAHAVFDAGITKRDIYAQDRLNKLFADATNRGFLGRTYAGTNTSEYWAEGVQAWFNAASCSRPENTPTCSQIQLYQNDPNLWHEIAHWFPAPSELSRQLYPAITPPPAALQLDRNYYRKYIDASGIPIVASSTVSDAALFKMKYIVDTMVNKDAYTLQALRQNVKRVLIIPKSDGMTSLPEYVALDQTNPLQGSTWNQRAQGVGWTEAIPYVSCSEANLLHSGQPLDRYPDESICIHEFAHAVFDAGVVKRDAYAQGRLDNLFNDAVRRKLLGSTYAGTASREYWAEGVQAWFNAASCSNPNNTPTCNQARLYQSDPNLWYEIGHWFPAPSEINPQIYP